VDVDLIFGVEAGDLDQAGEAAARQVLDQALALLGLEPVADGLAQVVGVAGLV
jgi:hypothetical protein